jgi:hypothetical protein
MRRINILASSRFLCYISMMLRRRVDLLLAIVVVLALLAALPLCAAGRDLTPVAVAVRQTAPAIATDGVDFFAAWTETAATASRIVAGRVTRSGLPLDGTGVIVAESSSSATRMGHPAVTFGAGGCLVIFTIGVPWDGDLMGRRYTRDGTPIDPAPFLIAHNAGAASVAFGGTRFLVAWPRYTARSIIGTTVAADGSVGVEQQLTPSATAQEPDERSGDVGRPAIAWNGSHFILAYVLTEYAITNFDPPPVVGYRVRLLRASPLGTPLDVHTIRAVEGGTDAAIACSAQECAVSSVRGSDIVAVLVHDDASLQTGAPKIVSSSRTASSSAIAFDGASYILPWRTGDSLLGLVRIARGGQPYALATIGNANATEFANTPFASDPPSPPAAIANAAGDTGIVTSEFDKVSLTDRVRFYFASEVPVPRRRATF